MKATLDRRRNKETAMSLDKKGKSTVLLASFLGHYCTKVFFLVLQIMYGESVSDSHPTVHTLTYMPLSTLHQIYGVL